MTLWGPAEMWSSAEAKVTDGAKCENKHIYLFSLILDLILQNIKLVLTPLHTLIERYISRYIVPNETLLLT